MSRSYPSSVTQPAGDETLRYRVAGVIVFLLLVLWLSLLGDLYLQREKERQASVRELEALAAITADRLEASLVAADVGLAYLADLWRRGNELIFARLVEDYLQSPAPYARGALCIVEGKGKILFYSEKEMDARADNCLIDDKAQTELSTRRMPHASEDKFSISPAWLPAWQSGGVRIGRSLDSEKDGVARWITMTISGDELRQSLAISTIPPEVAVVLATNDDRLFWRSASDRTEAKPRTTTDLKSDPPSLSAEAQLTHYPVRAVVSRALIDVFSASNLLQRRYYAFGALTSIILMLGGGWLYYILKRQRALARQMQNVRGERLLYTENPQASRIAREIHDDLGQKLMVLRMDVAMLARRVGEESPAILVHTLADLKAQVDSAIDSARAIVRDLLPVEMNTSLIPAVRGLVDVFRNTFDITIDFNSNFSEETSFDAAFELTAFRIIQESFSNVIRHAKATHISLNLEITGGQMKIKVQDDGVGFSIDKKRIALGSIGERAILAGGKVFTTNRQEGGACVEVLLPLAVSQINQTTIHEALTWT